MRALVTGASRGIGAAIARALLAQAESRGQQASLALAASKPGEELTALGAELTARGARVICLHGDLSDPQVPARLVEQAQDFCQGLDTLVCNAGIMAAGPLAELESEHWDRLINVNLKASWLLAKAAFPALRDSQGSLVAVASMSGLYPHPGAGAYSASKAGLIMLCRQLALEWASVGVRVNAVAPGMVRTGLTEHNYQNPETAAKRQQLVPLGRVATPEDIANSVAFLADAQAAAYVTGQCLGVDGGFPTSIMAHIPNATPGR